MSIYGGDGSTLIKARDGRGAPSGVGAVHVDGDQPAESPRPRATHENPRRHRGDKRRGPLGHEHHPALNRRAAERSKDGAQPVQPASRRAKRGARDGREKNPAPLQGRPIEVPER